MNSTSEMLQEQKVQYSNKHAKQCILELPLKGLQCKIAK